LLSVSWLNASYVIVNDGIISQKVSQKVETMGSELFAKSGVSVYVAIPSSLEGKSIVEYGNELSSELKNPYVLLSLAKNEEQVDIVYSKSLESRFDKEGILSPLPWSGTIIPILTAKKENDKYNAAVLNGYADIVEQIADSYGMKLDSALGNVNKDIYHYLKIGIYGFLLIVFARYFYRKIGKKYV
jgi:uncharacterized membrane protein YgcG